MATYTDGQISADEYENLNAFDKWIHRVRFGSPTATYNPRARQWAPKVDTSWLPVWAYNDPHRRMQLSGDPHAEGVPPPDDYGGAFSQPSVAEVNAESDKFRGLLGIDKSGGSSPASSGGSSPASNGGSSPASNGTLDTMEKIHDAIYDPSRTVDFSVAGPMSDTLIEMAGTSPEERMIDTHMDNQRAIIAGNNAAREGRIPYSPDAEAERRKTLARTRNKRTGQVDELSNLGGGRGAMLIRLANENRQDLSTPEGRRAAFGPAPTTDPAQAGPQLGDWTGRTELSPHQLRGVAPGATISSETGRVISGVGTPGRERRLNRKKDVGEYYNKLASAAPSATDAASQGISLAAALRGVPPSARRAARNAYIAEQQRQRATERTVQIAEAQAGGGPAGPALDRRVGPLLAVLENPHSTVQQKEHANRMLMAIVAGMQP